MFIYEKKSVEREMKTLILKTKIIKMLIYQVVTAK